MPSSARDSGWRYWIFGDLQVSWRKRIGYTQWPSTLASKKHVGLVIMHKLWHHLVICSRKKWKMGEHPPTKTRRWMKTRNSLLCVSPLVVLVHSWIAIYCRWSCHVRSPIWSEIRRVRWLFDLNTCRTPSRKEKIMALWTTRCLYPQRRDTGLCHTMTTHDIPQPIHETWCIID